MSSDSQDHLQTTAQHSPQTDKDSVSVFTPRRRSVKASKSAVSTFEDGQADAIRQGNGGIGTPHSIPHSSPDITRYSTGQSRLATSSSATRRRRASKLSTHEEGQVYSKPLADERFERMLALLDNTSEDSEANYHQQQHLATNNGFRGYSSREGNISSRELRVNPQTPSSSSSPSRSLGYAHQSADVAQQATSFETLRQIVSATSPNSRPRRHREFHHALAGQTSGFERGRSTSLDEFDSDSKTVRLDQRGKARDDGYQTREHEQGIMPTAEPFLSSPRATAVIPGVAHRRRTNQEAIRPRQTSATLRYAMQPSPPSPSRSLEPVVGNHSSSTQIGMGGYVRPERKISPHRQQSRRRLPPAVAPFQERKGQHQTQDLTSTGSLSDEDNGEQEDVLDTAPPSDLDERFPALSPQPSPLNSRRHGQVGRSPHIEGVSSVTDREERFQMRMRADTPKTDGQWQYGEAGPPFYPDELRQDDSRWNETKGMVDAFLSSKEHQRRGSATNAHQRSIGNLETRMVSSDTTRQHLSGRQESGIAKTPLSASTVLDRIDSVTNEVHALRSQIAELVTLIPRLLVAGVEPGRGISDVVADVAELGRDHRIQSQEQETIHLPNPIKIQSLLLHLDFLVHHRAVPLTDGAVTGDAPARSERDILHVCESRNLDLIREKVTDWEGVMRGREPVGLVRKGSQ